MFFSSLHIGITMRFLSWTSFWSGGSIKLQLQLWSKCKRNIFKDEKSNFQKRSGVLKIYNTTAFKSQRSSRRRIRSSAPTVSCCSDCFLLLRLDLEPRLLCSEWICLLSGASGADDRGWAGLGREMCRHVQDHRQGRLTVTAHAWREGVFAWYNLSCQQMIAWQTKPMRYFWKSQKKKIYRRK